MPSTPSVALVGVGQRGLNHLQQLWRLQGEEVCSLTALVDPFADNLDPDKIRRWQPDYDPRGVACYETVDEMLAAGGVDAVWFAIPPNQHHGEVERVADAGLALFAEKPQTLYFDEALAQADAIQRSGVPNVVGFQMRHHPPYEAIRNHLAGKWVAGITMVAEGAVEGHGVKHTHAEERGGPANRIWTANRAWSGTSMVEAGIHQTDIMRYWTDDDVEWVRADYVERPQPLHATEGDNPIFYAVTYGFRKGGVGTLIFTKPARSYYHGRFDTIVWQHGTIKFEDGAAVDYHYPGADWSPALRPDVEQTRHVLAENPGYNGMALDNTYQLAKTFVEAATGVATDAADQPRNDYQSSLNSLAAVLAANVSASLDGAKVPIAEFAHADEYAAYRRRPSG